MGESQIVLVESLSWSLKTLFTLWIVFTLHSFPFQAQAAPSGNFTQLSLLDFIISYCQSVTLVALTSLLSHSNPVIFCL